jgi:hypothetical protein
LLQVEEFIYKTPEPPFPSRRPECHGRATKPPAAAPWAPPQLSRRPTSAPRQQIARSLSLGRLGANPATHCLGRAPGSPEAGTQHRALPGAVEPARRRSPGLPIRCKLSPKYYPSAAPPFPGCEHWRARRKFCRTVAGRPGDPIASSLFFPGS